jgi:hypothetical protein
MQCFYKSKCRFDCFMLESRKTFLPWVAIVVQASAGRTEVAYARCAGGVCGGWMGPGVYWLVI